MERMRSRLTWTHYLLASGKYFGAVMGSAGFAIAIATRDPFFVVIAVLASLYALALAAIQIGLRNQRRWARLASIGFSLLQVPSALVLFAVLSLRDLFSRDVTAHFVDGAEPPTTPATWWSTQRWAAAVFATVFALLVLSSLIFGNGLGFREAKAQKAGAIETPTVSQSTHRER